MYHNISNLALFEHTLLFFIKIQYRKWEKTWKFEERNGLEVESNFFFWQQKMKLDFLTLFEKYDDFPFPTRDLRMKNE